MKNLKLSVVQCILIAFTFFYAPKELKSQTFYGIELNQHKNRQNFEICLDGGVNQTTVKYLNVESVVSGSFILSAPNPIKNIMLLQTSGEYEKY